MRASPAVGRRKPMIIFIVVDLPAPFGPRNPSTSPRATVSDTRSTALMEPNDFVSSRVTIISSIDPCFLSDLEVRRFDEPACIRGHSGGEKLPFVNRPRQPTSRWPTAQSSTAVVCAGQPGGGTGRRDRTQSARLV